ncbi:energy transducer TonB [Salinarimonas rosea]|uniref:energy transducer TonB n=1 Tax=Salinarimonas rosea TaxID=552063 RepID=UPI0004225700|nr:energy transducer TonB [Salinarimonas rosea]
MSGRRGAARLAAWLAAAGLAGAAHAALGLALLPQVPPPEPAAAPDGFLAVEIAALPSAPLADAAEEEPPAPEATADEAAPAPAPPPDEPAREDPAPEDPAPEALAPPEQPPEPVPEAATEPEPAPVTAPMIEAAAPPFVLPPPRPTDLPPPQRPRATRAAPPAASPGRDTFDSARAAARAAQTREHAAAPEPARASSAGPAERARWQARLLAHLERHKRYPAAARAQRIEGVVHVTFGLDARGSVTSARVARSSGASALDEAAVAMVRRASPAPAPPEGAVTLTVPVRFDLR